MGGYLLRVVEVGVEVEVDNTLQRTATNCEALHRTVTHSNTLQHAAFRIGGNARSTAGS